MATTRLMDRRWTRLLAAAFGVLVPLVWVLTVVAPGEEAVKIRNALVLQVGAPSDFDWTPENMPASFQVNKRPVPEDFQKIATQLMHAAGPNAGGFDVALEIARHLQSGAQRGEGGPIQSNLKDAYVGITRDGRGYCADFTQVFSALAVAAGMPVRTWGISFESFGAGHAFNEVYDRSRGKWVLVDSFHSLYFADPDSREPLSVVEVHDRLLGLGRGGVTPVAVPIVPDRFGFSSGELALDYYRNGMPQLALSWGNNVFDYDASPVVRLLSFSRYLERAAAIATGVYPAMMVYPVTTSDRDVRSLLSLRDRFLLACGALAAAAIVFGLQIAGLISRRT